MTVCESDSGLCWNLDEETLARAILTFCLNTADALMTALLKGTADAWEALTLIRDSDPELRTSAGAGKVIEQAFCIGMTRWGSKPTPQAVRSFRSALAKWQQRLRTLPTWDRDYLCGWVTNGSSRRMTYGGPPVSTTWRCWVVARPRCACGAVAIARH